MPSLTRLGHTLARLKKNWRNISMGAVCSVICGLIVATIGICVWADDWVDDSQRWASLGICLTLGLGTILHAVGVW